MIDFACCNGVDVVIVREGVEHGLVLAQVGHKPEFDLRVIGAEKHVALRWDEGATYFTAIVGADGYVLQVWIDAREASGCGDCLLVGGVDASGGGVDECGQCVDVSGKEFANTSQLQYFAHQRMSVLQSEQDFLGGGVLASLGLLCLVAEL